MSAIFASLQSAFSSLDASKKDELKRKINGVFEFVIKTKDGAEQTWTLDVKNNVDVSQGKKAGSPDVSITVAESDLVDIASGKLTGSSFLLSNDLRL